MCLGIATACLAVPAAIAYDPYAWLVWGREIGRGQLHTVGGPSWKPLPILATTLAGPAGAFAPALWLVVARTGTLLAVVGVYRLAGRFAGRWAGAIAVVALVLSPDPGPRFVRLYLEGHTGGITAALAVWAVDRHLDGKHGTALVLGALLALDRPEAWPFLAVYALWCWRHDRGLRPLIIAAGLVVPVAWFGGDWWGSGSPFHGADSARVLAQDDHRFADGLRRVAEVVIVPAWLAAAFAMADARRRRDRTILVLGGGAVVWFTLVVAMSALLGYAALSRFLLPGAAIVCVLAGVGVMRFVLAIRTSRARVLAVVVLVVLALPIAVWRGYGIGAQVDEVAARAAVIDDLTAAIDAAGGADAVAGCGRVAITDAGVPRMAAAWELDVPLAAVHGRATRAPTVAIVTRPRGRIRGLERARTSERQVRVLARNEGWQVLAVHCPP